VPPALPPDGPFAPEPRPTHVEAAPEHASSSAPAAAPRPRLLDAVSVFRYVTVDNAPNYRALLEVFVEAKERYLIELRPADVRDGLDRSGLVFERASELEPERHLDQHLDQLAEWGNLQRAHDTAAVARVEDFYRRRFLYRLTPAGEAAHRAVREVEAAVGRSGALQTSMLVEVREALAAVTAAAGASDGAALVRALHRLHAAFESLTAEANLFLGELDRHAAAERVDEERFLAYKHALLAYLGRFVEDLRRLRPEIGDGLREAETLGPERFLPVAAAAANLPPPAPGDRAGEDPRSRWVNDQRARWEGIRAWFSEAAPGGPRVERLHAAARAAVVKLTRSLERLVERRARPVDRAADFRTLARWFAACASDDEAHALWSTAFGLHPARHFTLEEDDPERVRPEASWWDAEPVDVPVRLRTHGAISRAGRPPPALDFGDGRAWLAAVRRRERAAVDAALARFAGRGPLRLSALGALDGDELAELLALLDEALVAPRDEDGARRARTADGRLEIALSPPPRGEWVTIATPAGRLRCLDYGLEVSPAAGAGRVRAAGEGTP
jgi:uncharacterized protein (TIGR02677 family)